MHRLKSFDGAATELKTAQHTYSDNNNETNNFQFTNVIKIG